MEYLPVVVSVASATVAFLSAAVAVLNYRVARKAFRDLHEYNRRRFAVELIQNWDARTQAARVDIVRNWRDHYDHNRPIPWAEIEAVQQTNLADTRASRALPIMEQIQVVLNYLELIASSVLNEVADEEMVRFSYRGAFGRWYTITQPYRDELQRRMRYSPWEPIETLYRQWYPEPAVPHRDRTG